MRLALPIELAHARNGARYVINCTLDCFELAPSAGTEIGLPLQERFGVKRNGRDRVVDIVRDTARHLAKSQETLLLQHGFLCLAQVVVRPLQGAIEFGLMGCQGDVLAQLVEKFALAAAEGVRSLAGRDEDAEHFALGQQWSGNHRAQTTVRQPLGKRERDLADIRLVNQLAAHTA